MDGNVVMVMSFVSSLIAVVAAIFSFYISPKSASPTKESGQVNMGHVHMTPEEIEDMLKTLKNGGFVKFPAQHLDQTSFKHVQYQYGHPTDKKSGLPLPSAT